MKAFSQHVAEHIGPPLQERGYTLTLYPGFKDSVVFRKQMDPWFIYITFQYNHRNRAALRRFDIHTTRLLVDKPFGQYIRDQEGKYIPGSLIGGVSAPDGPGWLYTTAEELTRALDTALPKLLQEIDRLEDPTSSMDL